MSENSDIPDEYHDSLVLADIQVKKLNEQIKAEEIKAEILKDIPKFEKVLENEKLKAQALATRELLPEIQKSNTSELSANEKIKKEHRANMPAPIVPKPNAVKNFFMNWGSSDGKVFKTYEEYAKNQSGLLSAWTKKNEKIDKENISLSGEKKAIEDIKKDGLDLSPEALNRALKLSENQRYRRPNLFEKIKNKAAELIEKAPVFSHFREMRSLVSEVKNDLAAADRERRRSQEPTQTQGMKR